MLSCEREVPWNPWNPPGSATESGRGAETNYQRLTARCTLAICTVAGLEGTYTNHSGKVTQATSLYQKGFDEQAIMARTGHRNTTVRAYKRPSNAQLKDVSNSLKLPSHWPKKGEGSPRKLAKVERSPRKTERIEVRLTSQAVMTLVLQGWCSTLVMNDHGGAESWKEVSLLTLNLH